jgi:transcriptional regulator with GAF, ATPase, and Fis domain
MMPAEPRSLKLDLELLERQNILGALEESNWKIKGDDNAASRLGLSPSTLRSRMKRLGIAKPSDARGGETSPARPH